MTFLFNSYWIRSIFVSDVVIKAFAKYVLSVRQCNFRYCYLWYIYMYIIISIHNWAHFLYKRLNMVKHRPHEVAMADDRNKYIIYLLRGIKTGFSQLFAFRRNSLRCGWLCSAPSILQNNSWHCRPDTVDIFTCIACGSQGTLMLETHILVLTIWKFVYIPGSCYVFSQDALPFLLCVEFH